MAPGRTRRVENGFCESAGKSTSFTAWKFLRKRREREKPRGNHRDRTEGTSPSWKTFSPDHFLAAVRKRPHPHAPPQLDDLALVAQRAVGQRRAEPFRLGRARSGWPSPASRRQNSWTAMSSSPLPSVYQSTETSTALTWPASRAIDPVLAGERLAGPIHAAVAVEPDHDARFRAHGSASPFGRTNDHGKRAFVGGPAGGVALDHQRSN